MTGQALGPDGQHGPAADGTETDGTGGDRAIARAVLLLYPRAWRDRYGEEIHALLAESGCTASAIGSLAWSAIPAWLCPPRHLHDRDGRMRSSLGTVLAAWSALTGLGIVFVQLTQLQGFAAPGHPLVNWSYLIFDAALALSVLAAAAGGLPLWLHMVRRARRDGRRRELAWLWLAVAAPAAFIVASAVALRLVHHPEGAGARWFLAFAVLGFAVAGLASAGPIVALHRLRPRGSVVHLAASAAGIAAAASSLGGAASGLAAVGLCLWDPAFAGFHHGGLLTGYLLLVVLIAATGTVSAARGIRARHAAAAG